MMHLTAQTLDRLLAGSLAPAEARALAEHLGGDCPECEALLERAGPGALDGVVDEALLGMAPPLPAERGSDLEFARIRRALRRARPGRARAGRIAALAAALVAVAGVAVKVAWLDRPRPAAWDGVKGPAAAAIPVRLRFLVVHPVGSGRPPELERGASGETVAPSAALQFRIELARPGFAALVRVGVGGDADLFWSGRVDAAGTADVTAGGRPAAYPLAGLAGRQRVVLVASPEPLEVPRVLAAARALAPPAAIPAEGPALEGLSFDVVEVTVR